MTRTIRLILIAAAMTVFFVGMVVDHTVRRATGTEVMLDLEPVDPRDLLAGYYIILSTPLHRIEIESVSGDDEFQPGNDIFVVIEADELGNFQPTAIYGAAPEAGLFIRGKVQRAHGTFVRAIYNLERFYADEETAQELETRRRENTDRLRLIVSVGSDGRALIRGLEIDEERQIDDLF